MAAGGRGQGRPYTTFTLFNETRSQSVVYGKHVAQNCEFDCQGREIPDVRRAPRLWRNGKEQTIYLFIYLFYNPGLFIFVIYWPPAVWCAAHGPGLFHRVRGVGSGQRAERLRHHVHPRQGHGHRWGVHAPTSRLRGLLQSVDRVTWLVLVP